MKWFLIQDLERLFHLYQWYLANWSNLTQNILRIVQVKPVPIIFAEVFLKTVGPLAVIHFPAKQAPIIEPRDIYAGYIIGWLNKAGYTAISCGRLGRGGNARFLTFRLDGYRRTDRRTDRRMDKASYRVACPQLKITRGYINVEDGCVGACLRMCGQ